MKNRHRILHNILLYSVFACYILIVVFLLFLKRHDFRSLNLIPFHSIFSYLSGNRFLKSFALSNILGNIVLFVPMGVYLSVFLRKNKPLRITLFVILMSVIAEVIQYVCRRGVADIDDVILNGLGGFLGVLSYQILFSLCKDKFKVRRIVEVLAPVTCVVCFIILYLYNR